MIRRVLKQKCNHHLNLWRPDGNMMHYNSRAEESLLYDAKKHIPEISMCKPSYCPMVDSHCYIFCWNPLTPSSPLGLAHHHLLVLAVPAAGLRLKDDALAKREDGQAWPRLSQIPGRCGHTLGVLNVGKIERKQNGTQGHGRAAESLFKKKGKENADCGIRSPCTGRQKYTRGCTSALWSSVDSPVCLLRQRVLPEKSGSQRIVPWKSVSGPRREEKVKLKSLTEERGSKTLAQKIFFCFISYGDIFHLSLKCKQREHTL